MENKALHSENKNNTHVFLLFSLRETEFHVRCKI